MAFASESRSSVFSSTWASIFWKQRREITPLLLTFIGITALIAGLSTTAAGQVQFAEPYLGWYRFLWVICGLMGLCTGLILFSTEKENGTFSIYQNLPISSLRVTFSILFSGLIAVTFFVLIAVVMQAIEYFLVGEQLLKAMFYRSRGLEFVSFYLPFLLIPWECFLIGALSSILVSQTLLAVVISFFLILAYFSGPGILYSIFQIQNPSEFSAWLWIHILWKSIAIPALLFVFYQRALRWLGPGHAATSPELKHINALINDPSARPRMYSALVRPLYARTVLVLLWQSFRQFRRIYLGLGGIAFIGFLIAYATNLGKPPGIRWDSEYLSAVFYIIPAVLGLLTFVPDHTRNGYRFFQLHGEYPKTVWMTRVLPGLIISSICFAILVLSFWRVASNRDVTTELICAAFASTILSFAVAQLSSMLNRSFIYSFAISLVAWVILLILLNTFPHIRQFPDFFFFPLPFAIALLGCTLWWSKRWILQKNQTAESNIPCLIMVCVGIALFGCYSLFRLSESPAPARSFATMQSEYDNAILVKDSRSTRFLNTYLNSKLSTDEISPLVMDLKSGSSQTLDSILHRNASAIDELNQFFKSPPEPTFLPIENWDEIGDRVSRVRRLIIARALKAEAEDDLSKALQHWLELKSFEEEFPVRHGYFGSLGAILRWAELPNQSPKLLKEAIQKIHLSVARWQKFADRVRDFHLAEYESECHQLNQVPYSQKSKFIADSENLRFLNSLICRMPWELERSRRLCHYKILATHDSMNHGLLTLVSSDTNSLSSLGSEPVTKFVVMRWKPFDYQNAFGITRNNALDSDFSAFLKYIQMHRYTKLRLAVLAFQMEHSHYPDSVGTLVPEYLATEPCDVLTGDSFFYEPNGLNKKSKWFGVLTNRLDGSNARVQTHDLREHFEFEDVRRLPYSSSMVIPAHQPFLLPWSTAPKATKTEFLNLDGGSETMALRPFEMFVVRFTLPPISKSSKKSLPKIKTKLIKN
ncbi:MAG: hypothetical protein AAF623_00565 [Planctomycetota bacterium]